VESVDSADYIAGPDEFSGISYLYLQRFFHDVAAIPDVFIKQLPFWVGEIIGNYPSGRCPFLLDWVSCFQGERSNTFLRGKETDSGFQYRKQEWRVPIVGNRGERKQRDRA
jgi:hypothetical protein